MKTLNERLKEKVIVNNKTGCHEWQGAKAGVGYGYFTIRRPEGNKNYYIHRAVYASVNGEIPKGMRVLHLCDNPCCCNIDHLFIGTSSDNTRDMINKNRHPAHMREGWINTKITEQQYKEFINPVISVLSLSKKHGISRDTISEIRKTKDKRRVCVENN